MDQQSASALAERIEREPGWRAETTYNARAGAWAVKAWARGSDTAETFTSSYAWHYFQAQMAASIKRMKAWRRRVRQ